MKMRRALAIIATLILVCSVAVVPAFAASGINDNEQAVYDALFEGVKIGNTTVYFLDARQAEVTNFFNQDGVDMTDAQKDEIMSYLNKAFALATNADVIAWANAGKTSLAELPQSVKEVLLESGTKACAVMGLTFVYTAAGNRVTITDAEGNVLVDTTAVVKQTGSVDYTAIILGAVALVAVLAGAAFVATRKTCKAAA